jgi:hypothetical protein
MGCQAFDNYLIAAFIGGVLVAVIVIGVAWMIRKALNSGRQDHGMKIDAQIHVHLHSDADAKVLAKLDEILTAVTTLGATMAGELDGLTTQVQANSDVIDSAITLIRGIKASLDNAIAANDPAALQALSNALGAKDTELAQAVAENTPPVHRKRRLAHVTGLY